MGKTYSFRQLIKKLKKYDPGFEVFERRGKGSERMLYHPDVDGRPESYPIKCHGEGDEVKQYAIKDIVKRFKLPKDLF